MLTILSFLNTQELHTLKLVSRSFRTNLVSPSLHILAQKKLTTIKAFKLENSLSKPFYLQIISQKLLKLQETLQQQQNENQLQDMIKYLNYTYLKNPLFINSSDSIQKSSKQGFQSKSEQDIDGEVECLSKIKKQIDQLSGNSNGGNDNYTNFLSNLYENDADLLQDGVFLQVVEQIEVRFCRALLFFILYSLSDAELQTLTQKNSNQSIKTTKNSKTKQDLLQVELMVEIMPRIFKDIESINIVKLPIPVCETIQSQFLWKYPLVDISEESEEIMFQRKKIPFYEAIHLYLSILTLCNKQNLSIDQINSYKKLQELEKEQTILQEHAKKAEQPLKYIPKKSQLVKNAVKTNVLSMIFGMFDIEDIANFRLVSKTWKFAVDSFLKQKVNRTNISINFYQDKINSMDSIEKSFEYRQHILKMSQKGLQTIQDQIEHNKIFTKLVQVHYLVSKNIEKNELSRQNSCQYYNRPSSSILRTNTNTNNTNNNNSGINNSSLYDNKQYDFQEVTLKDLNSFMKEDFKFMRFAFDVYGYKLDCSLIDRSLWTYIQKNFLQQYHLKRLFQDTPFNCIYHWLLLIDLIMSQKVTINQMLDYLDMKQTIKKLKQITIRPKKMLHAFEKSQQERRKIYEVKDRNNSVQSDKQFDNSGSSSKPENSSLPNNTFNKNSSESLCDTETQSSDNSSQI